MSVTNKPPDPKTLPKKVYDIMDKTMSSLTNYSLNSSMERYVLGQLQAFINTANNMPIHNMGYSSNVQGALTYFESDIYSNVNLRTYGMLMGFFSAIQGTTPYILAVIPRKDYVYHRTSILMGRPLDLSRVVILVDRRLDLPGDDDIPKSFKALYQKTLENTIRSTGASIFKVPGEFIKENCFLSTKFEITSRDKKERRKQSSQFLTKFYNSLGVTIKEVAQKQFEDMLEEAGVDTEVITPEIATPQVSQVSEAVTSRSTNIHDYLASIPAPTPAIDPYERFRAGARRTPQRPTGTSEALQYLINVSAVQVPTTQVAEAPMTDAERAALEEMNAITAMLSGGADEVLPTIVTEESESDIENDYNEDDEDYNDDYDEEYDNDDDGGGSFLITEPDPETV